MSAMASAEARRTSSWERARDILTSPVVSIAITFVLVVIAGLIVIGPRYLSASNISIIGLFVAVPLLIGACSGFALLAGVVDLSIGSMVGVSAAIFASLFVAGWEVIPAALATLLVCSLFGGVNSLAIVRFGGNPIAVTLGMLTALRGLSYVLNQTQGLSGAIPAFDIDLFTMANATFGSVPVLFLLALGVTVVAAIVVTKTRVGRHVKAVGGDERAAARAGISVAKVRTAALLLSALGAAAGGIITVGLVGGATRQTGFGMEFQVYAALMIGGYSILRGGVGNPIGGALGLLAVAGLTNILSLSALSPWYADIFVGLLLLAAVVLDRLRGGEPFE